MEAAAVAWSKKEERTRIKRNTMEEDQEKTYYQDGVFIHLFSSKVGEDKIVDGTLTISKQEERQAWMIQWRSSANKTQEERSHDNVKLIQSDSNAIMEDDQRTPDSEDNSKDDDSEDTIGENARSRVLSSAERDWTVVDENEDPFAFTFNVPISQIKRYKKSSKEYGWRYVILQLRDGVSLPALHFHKSGFKELMQTFKFHFTKVVSHEGGGWYDVSLINTGALNKSFDHLNIFTDDDNNDASRSSNQLANNILQDPIGSAYSGLARVTSFLQDFINPLENQHLYRRPQHERGHLILPTTASHHDDDDDVINHDDEEVMMNGFELITCAQLGELVRVERGEMMNAETWEGMKDQDGKFQDVDRVKQQVFAGGVEASLRGEVWRYLLEVYDWSKSKEENELHRVVKEEEYEVMKQQWKSMSQAQMNNFNLFSTRRSLIEKDVTRTDRTRTFYADEHGWGQTSLTDILTTYCMYNFDLGYVQGMSDLLSVILEVVKHEADAFWCFVGYMNTVHDNFVMNQQGMRRQLRDLRVLTEFYDPKLWDFLHEKASSDLFFCFRWILVRFKREFSYDDIQLLWEVLWTKKPCANFHLIFCLALFDNEKETLMSEDSGFTEILKHVNEMAERIDLKATLSKAEGIYHQLKQCKEITPAVKSIIGL